MSNRILVFYGSYRSDRMGIRLAQFVVEGRVQEAHVFKLPLRSYPQVASHLANVNPSLIRIR